MRSKTNDNSGNSLSELRLIAKAVDFLAVLTGILYLRAVLVEGPPVIVGADLSRNVLGMLLLLSIATLALILAWRWEGIGGLVALLCAIGLGILVYETATNNKLLAAVLYSSPFFVTGGLFVACWLRGRQCSVNSVQ